MEGCMARQGETVVNMEVVGQLRIDIWILEMELFLD